MESRAKTFDIIVFGASGFTGKLVAEYLWSHYRGRPDALRWAMAGRSRQRLEDARREIGAGEEIAIIEADVGDPLSLARLAASTSVILSTAGPFQQLGEPMLEACAVAGTAYADLCGEPLWMREMIDRYDAQARASGARLCFSCGFDSLPFEMGVNLLQREAVQRFGQPLQRVQMRLIGARGAISAGTLASMMATLEDAANSPDHGRSLMDPFVLTPGFAGPAQPDGLAPCHDDILDSWAAPFFMAVINTKNVHRSNWLQGHPWGADFVYDEMVLTGPGDQGKAVASAMAEALQSQEILVPDGGGPSRAMRESGFYDLAFIGEGAKGERLIGVVSGRRDPGYGSTSRMLAETGLALAHTTGQGGIWTPFALLGETLAARLRDEAGVTFALVDDLTEWPVQGFEMLA